MANRKIPEAHEAPEARLQRLTAENDAQHVAERRAAEAAYTAAENAHSSLANAQTYREAVAHADWSHANRKAELAAEVEQLAADTARKVA